MCVRASMLYASYPSPQSDSCEISLMSQDMQQTFTITPISISKLWKSFYPNFKLRKKMLSLFLTNVKNIWILQIKKINLL